MTSILQNIRAELRSHADKNAKAGFQRFFKEGIQCYGVKSAVVGSIAKKYWHEIKNKTKPDIFALFEDLFSSDMCEEAFIVNAWGTRFKNVEADDLKTYEKWIGTYINNWAKCDGFCNHTVGDYIQKYPEKASELLRWARSKNRWVKRAAAVSLIVPAKHGQFLKQAFAISDILLLDSDDMVQKGYGWLLKEASRKHQKEVFDYVVKNKAKMPRTALRYAIELMPRELKIKAMAK